MMLLPERSVTTLDTVHCCDALSLLRALPDGYVDMMLTSPPYDNLRTYNGYTWSFEGIAQESYRVLKSGGVLVWVVGDATIDGSETLTSFRQALYFKDVCGFNVHDTMIWNKPASPGIYGKRCEQSYEFMFVFSKGVPLKWHAPMEATVTAGTTRRKTTRKAHGLKYNKEYVTINPFKTMQNVWRIQTDIPETDKHHPAVFPEALAERHILTWSNPGDIVMDFFIGSGTTAKMAMKNDRHYIGCDISAEYVNLARQRIQNSDPYQASILPTGDKQLSLFEVNT